MEISINNKLLHLIRSAPPGQGADISAVSGLTMDEIATCVSELQACGYQFNGPAQALRLVHEPDIPYPWEFSHREDSIHYLKETDSTMIVAREKGDGGAPHFSVVIADIQGKGRGRLERHWISSEGGLYFTIVLRPALPPDKVFQINFLASLVLVRVMNRLFDVNARVKWPNDILIHEKKVCGMISEMAMKNNRIDYISLGIGINVNNRPEIEEPNACSLKAVLGRPVSRCLVLKTFLDDFEHALTRERDTMSLIREWKEEAITLGRQVKVVTINDVHHGRAVDVDADGALVLETADGKRVRVIYGDCFLN